MGMEPGPDIHGGEGVARYPRLVFLATTLAQP